MHESSERGRNRDLRSSALWGTGGRGGDSRSSALWGKGGRGFIVTAVAVLALGAPLAATAAPGQGKGPSPSNRSGTFVSTDLQSKAKAHPNDLVKVIIQSSYGTTDARDKAKGLGQLMKLGRNLDLIGGVSVELPAKLIDKLSKLPGLSITPDAPVKTDGFGATYRSTQLNDPFVITVGAVDLGTSPRIYDDSVAYWSAYGHTYDGFWKPDISADGRYMVAAAPAGSTLAAERPDKVTAPGYMQLSGTSFAAPVVAGTAAQLIARHPTWGPDQVKGALMRSARPIPAAAPFQGGVGQLNAVMANYIPNPPNPNKGLERWVVADPAGGSVPVFDAVSWYDAAKADISWDTISWDDVSWDSVSWDSVSWDSVSWDTVSWADVSWSDVSWSDVSWSDVSWADVSWADSSKEDAVLGDGAGTDAVPIDATAATDIQADPSLTADPTLDYSVLDAFVAPTDTTVATDTVTTDTSVTLTP